MNRRAFLLATPVAVALAPLVIKEIQATQSVNGIQAVTFKHSINIHDILEKAYSKDRLEAMFNRDSAFYSAIEK